MRNGWSGGFYPLSLSMPLGLRNHGSGLIEAFLWGLLPDNESPCTLKINGEYGRRVIGRRRWERLAREISREPEEVVTRVRDEGQSFAELVTETRARTEIEGSGHKTLDRLAEKLGILLGLLLTARML